MDRLLAAFWREWDKDPVALLTLGAAATAAVAVLYAVILARRNAQRKARDEFAHAAEAQASRAELAELKGRLLQMTEVTSLRQEELVRSLNERLDRVSQHLGASVEETGRHTSDRLARLYERLAVIDNAQKDIAELSSRVVSLHDVLGNKQARGAFGQARMEAIVQDGLPRDSYRFQTTLSNGKKPDCLIQLPGSPSPLAIDAKFPLEAFEAHRLAADDAARRDAQRRIRVDVGRHIEDIAGKYLIPGETQDMAMLFVPAESIYAELHEAFPDLIQKAHRERVMIVSPNMLMLAVQTMMTIVKDARMREQAHLIQRETVLLLEDVARRERVVDFHRHFGQLSGGVEKILNAADKIAARGGRIERMDVEEKVAVLPLAPAAE